MEVNGEEEEKKYVPTEESDISTTNNLNSTNCSEEGNNLTDDKKHISNSESIKLSEETCMIKQESENEINASNQNANETTNKDDNDISVDQYEDKSSERLRLPESNEDESQSLGSPSVDELVETEGSPNLTTQLPSSVKLKRKSDSLALISSLYDDSDSGSDSQSFANVFSDQHSECFSSNSENSDSGDTEGSDTDLESIITRKPTYIPKQLKVKGELSVKDLPPIENLQISVKEEECIPFGKVYSIVDTLLVIQSLPDKPALNLDSIFFRHNGAPVGRIFDVFGPVKRPFYSVRFNTNKEIRENGLEVDVVLYAAPETKHTQYVFANKLMKEKGSDASWLDDCEPPDDCIDYSDDEEERSNKRKQKKKKKQPVSIKQEEIEDGSPARKKYLTFEERMNRNNLMRNKFYSKMQNSSSFKRSWDVGWHNRIDRPLSSTQPLHPLPPNQTNSAFQMRPPLFIPPPPTTPGPPPSMRSAMNVPFPPPLPPSSQHSQSPLPLFNPRQPPTWPPNRSNHQFVTPSQPRYPINNSAMQSSSVHIAQQVCPPHIPNMPPTPPPTNIFYRRRPPPPHQPTHHRPQFSSPSTSNNFFQFPQYPPGGNSF